MWGGSPGRQLTWGNSKEERLLLTRQPMKYLDLASAPVDI